MKLDQLTEPLSQLDVPTIECHDVFAFGIGGMLAALYAPSCHRGLHMLVAWMTQERRRGGPAGHVSGVACFTQVDVGARHTCVEIAVYRHLVCIRAGGAARAAGAPGGGRGRRGPPPD